MRNLRNVLEAEIEKLKNTKKDADQYKEKLARLEVENVSLQNQIEAINSMTKSKVEEFQRLEAQYKSQLNEKNGVLQALRDKLTDLEGALGMQTVLYAVEIERLHNVIDALYGKVGSLEQGLEQTTEKMNEELQKQQEAYEHERKANANQIKDLNNELSDRDSLNKKMKEETDGLRLQVSELEKDIEHWKERYKIIESSHKYLVDAVEKLRYNNQIPLKGIFPETSQNESEHQ